MSICAATTGVSEFSVVAFNPNGHSSEQVIRVPVVGTDWSVVGSDKKPVASTLLAIDERTLQLPMLYLNSYKMDAAEKAAAQEALRNKADHILTFSMTVPAVGYSTVSCSNATTASVAKVAQHVTTDKDAPIVVENSYYKIVFNQSTGLMQSITNKQS